MNNKLFILVLIFGNALLNSCSNNEAVPINLNSDNCESCRMTISDGKFGAELITDKGRVYKFDDISCMIQYTEENNHQTGIFYVNDYSKENQLINAKQAFYLKEGEITSPMRGNVAAFEDEVTANEFKESLNAESTTWEILSKQ